MDHLASVSENIVDRWRKSAGRRWCAVTFAIVGGLGLPAFSPAATLVVTSLAKSGAGSLRAALAGAQNGDVITFAVTGTITNVLTGGLTISNNLSIAAMRL
jgi:hypothetical protein